MSEKRFELDRIGIFDNKTNHFYYKTFDNEEVVDLLNALNDKNEELRQQLNELRTSLNYWQTQYKEIIEKTNKGQ